MNYRSCLILLYSILITSLLFSCVDDIDSRYFKGKRVVVNCILNRDSVQHLSLTYSSELGNTIYDEVEDASVSLYENDSLVGKFSKAAYSEWELKYRPKYGQSYQLVIKIDGRDSICAVTRFPTRINACKNAYNENEHS